jgi:hypothetical protein
VIVDGNLCADFGRLNMNMKQPVQLLGISNAIVDVLAHIEGDFLKKIDAVPGSMTLIDQQRAHEIYSMMGPATEMSGGSVANTVAGFANLGGSAAYIGRVKKDQLGSIFNHDMRSLGIDIRLEPGTDGAPTARSHILIRLTSVPAWNWLSATLLPRPLVRQKPYSLKVTSGIFLKGLRSREKRSILRPATVRLSCYRCPIPFVLNDIANLSMRPFAMASTSLWLTTTK